MRYLKYEERLKECGLATPNNISFEILNGYEIITGHGRCEHITPVLKSLHWLPVRSGVARIFCGEVLFTNKRNFLIYVAWACLKYWRSL